MTPDEAAKRITAAGLGALLDAPPIEPIKVGGFTVGYPIMDMPFNRALGLARQSVSGSNGFTQLITRGEFGVTFWS